MASSSVSATAAGRVRRHWPRRPFADLDQAAVAAQEIRAAPGWRVVGVCGRRPMGPPRTSSRHLDVLRGGARVPAGAHEWASPTVVALTPAGRRVTIGSPQRWAALQDACASRTLTAVYAAVAAAIATQEVCHDCVALGAERFYALRWLRPEQLRGCHCSRCGIDLVAAAD